MAAAAVQLAVPVLQLDAVLATLKRAAVENATTLLLKLVVQMVPIVRKAMIVRQIGVVVLGSPHADRRAAMTRTGRHVAQPPGKVVPRAMIA